MRIRSITIGALLTLAMLGTGCSPRSPRFVDEGSDYNAPSAIRLLESSDPGALASKPVEESEGLRHDALAALRGRGETGREAAQLITRTFAAAARGVPYYVERVRFEDKDGWLVLEASGRGSGTLADRRLWVIDDEGHILLYSSR